MQTPVTIIIPAHNQLDCCRQCIESIIAHTEYPHKLVLVDNGSTDGVSKYFDSVPGAIVVHNTENLGFPAGVNLGLNHAEGHIVLLNSDTIVPELWLTRLVAALDNAPRIGLVGPMSNCVSGPQLVTGHTFTSVEDINTYAAARARELSGQIIDTDRIVGFCMLIRDTAFEAVGKLDESFGIGNFEDDDYCLRVRRAGYRVCIAIDCFVFHYGSATFSALGFDADAFNALIAKNESTFNQKWGTDASAPRAMQVAEVLLKEARELAADGKNVAAVARIKDAIGLSPSYAASYCLLGELLSNLGNNDQAAEQFRRALRLDPNHAAARAYLDRIEGR